MAQESERRKFHEKYMNMLQARTEEQKEYIESILEKDEICAEWGIDIDSEYENCLFIDDCITFDTMAKIVDYLRK